MTAPLPPPDDELVSAHLDGETTAEEAARVAADPALTARLAELDAVRAQVAAPVDVPSFAREAALAAALEVFDGEVAPGAAGGPPGGAGPIAAAPSGPFGHAPTAVPPPAGWVSTEGAAPAPGSGPVDELAARRARRRPGWLLGAAAAVVVVLAIAGLARVATKESSTDLAATSAGAPATTSAPEQLTSEGGSKRAESTTQAAGDASRAPDAARPSTPPTTAPSAAVPSTVAPTTAPPVVSDGPATAGGARPLENLGSIGSAGDLARAVDSGHAGNGATTPTGEGTNTVGQALTCDAARRAADPELADLTLVAEATFEGQPVYVLSYTIDRTQFPAANGTTRIYAVNQTTCAVVEAITR